MQRIGKSEERLHEALRSRGSCGSGGLIVVRLHGHSIGRTTAAVEEAQRQLGQIMHAQYLVQMQLQHRSCVFVPQRRLSVLEHLAHALCPLVGRIHRESFGDEVEGILARRVADEAVESAHLVAGAKVFQQLRRVCLESDNAKHCCRCCPAR